MAKRPARIVWHRRMGLAAALVVLFVSATGLVLNHTEAFGLDRTLVRQDWLLGWYGLGGPDEVAGFLAGGAWVVAADGQVYLGDASPQALSGPKGAVSAGGAGEFVFVASELEALLLAPSGALIDRLTGDALPGPVSRVGRLADGRVAVEADAAIYAAGGDFLAWAPSAGPVAWSSPVAVPPEVEARFLQNYRGGGLPLSRILLDLHSGRFFGAAGPYVMDLFALLFVVLAATGVYSWWRNGR